MSTVKSWTGILMASGLLQIAMAIAHFGLQYEWQGVEAGGFPLHLRWALFALNFSWSTLVLLLGALMVHAARLGPTSDFTRTAVLTVGLFWTVHAVYVAVEPMPVPPRLQWIHGPIVAFPVTLAVLSGMAWRAARPSARGIPEM